MLARHTGGNVEVEKAFLPALRRHGIRYEKRTTRPSMSLCEQAGLFRGARVIISAHGQQMANAPFTEEGTLLVEVVAHRTPMARNEYPSMYALQAAGLPLTHRVIISRNPRERLTLPCTDCLVNAVRAHLGHDEWRDEGRARNETWADRALASQREYGEQLVICSTVC